MYVSCCLLDVLTLQSIGEILEFDMDWATPDESRQSLENHHVQTTEGSLGDVTISLSCISRRWYVCPRSAPPQAGIPHPLPAIIHAYPGSPRSEEMPGLIITEDPSCWKDLIAISISLRYIYIYVKYLSYYLFLL